MGGVGSLLGPKVGETSKVGHSLRAILDARSSCVMSRDSFRSVGCFGGARSNIVSGGLGSLGSCCRSSRRCAFLGRCLAVRQSRLFFTSGTVFVRNSARHILLPTVVLGMSRRSLVRRVGAKAIYGVPLLSRGVSVIRIKTCSRVFRGFIGFVNIESLVVASVSSSTVVPLVSGGDNRPGISGGGRIQFKLRGYGIMRNARAAGTSLQFFCGESSLTCCDSLRLNRGALSGLSSIR